MLTSFADDQALFASIMAGAAGYVLKQIRGGDLVQAIRTVGAGQSLLDPAVTKGVLDRLRTGKHLLKDETPGPPVAPGGAHPGAGRGRPDQQADRRGAPPGREDGQELRLQHPRPSSRSTRRAEAASYLTRHTTTPGS